MSVVQRPDAALPTGLPEPIFDANAKRVLAERYLARREDGSLESPQEWLWRVAAAIAAPEAGYAEKLGRNPDAVVNGVAHSFYAMMSRRDFLPNTPCLVNAGRPLSMLSACFVLPVPDSIDGIFAGVKAMALLQKSGGGTGFSFSQLRGRGAEVQSTGREASGPVSFMKVFNAATDSIKQGGVRRGANMGVLRVDHPDIFDFIRCKQELDAENLALFNRLADGGRMDEAALAALKQELLQTQFNNFNLSIGLTDRFMQAVEADSDFDLLDPRDRHVVRTIRARDLWDAIVEGAWQNGEPGVLFLDHPEFNPLPGLGPIEATNPCLTGETPVAVADGRGQVAIRELADAGVDVPVFCLDESGEIAIRMMRHPRVTGRQAAVFRVTLDDGSSIRATEHHKFLMREGGYKRVCELSAGDSLKVMTRFQASIKDVFSEAGERSQDYWWINNGRAANRLEHRYIAEFHHNTTIPNGFVVHHRDFNARNNAPANLEILSKADHDAVHGRRTMGDRNPMRRAATEWSADKWQSYRAKHSKNSAAEANKRYSGFTNDDLRDGALELTASLGRRFSQNDWTEYAKAMGLPTQLSGWRRHHLNGGLFGLAKWAAAQLGQVVHGDPRTIQHFYDALEAGYDAEIVAGFLFVLKNCERCQAPFSVRYVLRETAYCSRSCGTQATNRDPLAIESRQAGIRKHCAERRQQVREKQLSIYTKLKHEHGRVLRRQWVAACKDSGVSPEISRKSSPFTSYRELQDAATMFNHRVVSVEFDGYEDVYNGTVDDFHNFFSGGFESSTKNGKPKLSYLNNRQCGEQALHSGDACCLGSINVGHFFDALRNDVDWNRLGDTVALAIRFLDNVIDANVYPLEEIRVMAHGNRRVGLGIMGFADLLVQLEIPYGSDAAIAFAEKLMKFMRNRAEEMSEGLARERGDFPNKHLSKWAGDPRPRRNAALLSIAPTGTISMLAGASFGCEPYFGVAYTKHVMKDAEGRPQALHYIVPQFEEIATDLNFLSDELLAAIEANGGSVRGLRDVPEDLQRIYTTAADLSVDQHIDMLAAFQKHTCNAVSKSINAPHDDTRDNVARAITRAYHAGCKGFTYYRDRSRTEQVVTLATAALAPVAAAAAESIARHEPAVESEAMYRKRPAVMRGRTLESHVGCGKLYVTLNEDEAGRPFEVFFKLGKSGSCQQSYLEALGVAMSVGLRYGADPMKYVQKFEGMRCPNPKMRDGDGPTTLSCADGISQALARALRMTFQRDDAPPAVAEPQFPHIDIVGYNGLHANGNGDGNGNGSPHYAPLTARAIQTGVGMCPKCGGNLVSQGGCVQCLAQCGYIGKCG